MSDNTDPTILAGQLTVKAGGVSAEQIVAVLQDQDDRRIGDRLVEREWISRDEMERLIQQRDSSQANLEETVLGALAVRNGFLTHEQLAECLVEQESMRAMTGTPPRIGEIMVARELVGPHDIDAILLRQMSLLQGIVGEQDDENRDAGQPEDMDNNSATVSEGVASYPEAKASERLEDAEMLDGQPPKKKPRGGFMELLFPEEAQPLTCTSCGSSANSPLAIICSGCGGPLWSRRGTQKCTPWLLRMGFVVLAGVTGVFSLQAGPYVIAAVMFIILGTTMLRIYRPSQRFFLCASMLLLTGIYVGTQLLELTRDQVVEVARNGVVWDASWAGIAVLLALLTLTLIGPLAVPKVRGLGNVLLVFAVFLGIGWLPGKWVMGWPFPLWVVLSLGGVALALVVFVSSLMFVDGFRIKTRRPGVIVEATRPFAMPAQPQKQLRNLSELPALAKPVYLTFDGFVWSGRMSGYYMLSSIVRFSNGFAYWAQLVFDLLLRSLVRVWRRLLELTKALSKIIADMIMFAAMVIYRLALVIIFPLAAIAVSAMVGVALANAAVAYITGGGLANLASAAIYTAMLYILCVIVVGLLARCHPFHIVVREALQAFSFQLPNFLMLILGTSIILSLFRVITNIGPYKFGFLSIALTILVLGLFTAIFYKSKKKPSGSGASSAVAETQTVSTPIYANGIAAEPEEDELKEKD